MIKIFLVTLIFVPQTALSNNYIFKCKSQNFSIALSKKLTLTGKTNGWKMYSGTAVYSVATLSGPKTYQVVVDVHSRSGAKGPEFRTFSVAVLSPEDVRLKLAGLESGRVGSAGLDIRDIIRSEFKAKWQVYERWPELDSSVPDDALLSCSKN